MWRVEGFPDRAPPSFSAAKMFTTLWMWRQEYQHVSDPGHAPCTQALAEHNPSLFSSRTSRVVALLGPTGALLRMGARTALRARTPGCGGRGSALGAPPHGSAHTRR